jgi:hypothetical protein
MKHFNNLPWDDGSRRSPQDDGSRRSPQCPPSHPSMALPSHPAQAYARMAQPSGPSTHAALMGRVSPLLHQPGSKTYSPSTSAAMGGEYCPTAVPPMLLAPAILSYCSMAPFSDAITENSWPQNSLAKISQRLAQIEAMWALAQTLMEPLSHSPPLQILGGAQCRQHVICRRPEQVHQTAWQRG